MAELLPGEYRALGDGYGYCRRGDAESDEQEADRPEGEGGDEDHGGGPGRK